MSTNSNFRHYKGSKSQQRRQRALHMEALEERALLSASPLDAEAAGVVPAMVAPAETSGTPASENGVIVDLGGDELQGPKASPETSLVVADDAVYNAEDVARLRTFLEQAGMFGTNGSILSYSYDADDPTTWSGVTWSEIDGELRVTKITWSYAFLGGSLDLSGCTTLTELDCYFNQLTSLNVTGCTALTTLNCSFNQLTELDVSDCSKLEFLWCTQNYSLATLNAAGCSALESLNCSSLALTSLNLEGCTALEWLDCSYNGLTSLDVSGCAALTQLDCYYNALTSLNVEGCTSMVTLGCHFNQLGSLSVAGCTSLATLDCQSNQLTALDVTGCTALKTLSCVKNQLASLDVAECTALTTLYCDDNQLTELNVTENTALTSLSCTNNQLVTLDVAGCTALQNLSPWSSNLKRVVFNPAVGSMGVSFYGSDTTWCVQDVNGHAYTGTYYLYRAGDSLTLPITAVNEDGSQVIVLSSVPAGQLAIPTLSVTANGSCAANVTVGSVVDASGYTLQYSTNANFFNATTQKIAAGTTSIGGLIAGSTYYFRVLANGTKGNPNSDYSEAQSATTEELGNATVSIDGKKVTVRWEDSSTMSDVIRYRAVGAARWTTQKLKAGVTEYSFNAQVGTDYEIEVQLDQNEHNTMRATAVVLDQPKLSADKNDIHDDTFQVSVTNYTAKNLAANVTQAILTVNGVQTVLDIENQQGSAALANGGNVTFDTGRFTFTEMACSTQYKVQVAFTDGVSVSTASTALSVKTTKTCYQAPEILSATAISDTTILVEWETAYGKNSETPAQKYTVQYSTDGEKWTNATTSATGNSFTIQRLKGGNKYQVRVLASKDSAFEVSAPSEVLVAETLALPKVALEKNFVTDDTFLLNVTNCQNTNLATKATMVNVVTDKLGTAVIELQNGTGSAIFDNGMNVAFADGALLFTDAPSSTQLKVQVSFANETCTTALSQAVTVKTAKAAYNTPVILNGFAASSTSVTVEWETVYGKNSTTPAQSYTVQYSTDGVRWTNATTKATGTSFTITRLKANTQYLIAVFATKDQLFNASELSEALLVTTAELI